MLISGCTLPLIPAKDTEAYLDLEHYLAVKPLYQRGNIYIQRLPAGFDGEKILDAAEEAIFSARQLLDGVKVKEPVYMVLFSSEEATGNALIRENRAKHQATGFYKSEKNILVVVGNTNNQRFWTIVRHEMGHTVLYETAGPDTVIPFWLNEGIAISAEMSGLALPMKKNDRWLYIRYLFEKKEPLNFRQLIKKGNAVPSNGSSYARSWALVRCLQLKKRPIQKYLLALAQRTNTEQELFSQELLLTGETIENFEKSCQNILLESYTDNATPFPKM